MHVIQWFMGTESGEADDNGGWSLSEFISLNVRLAQSVFQEFWEYIETAGTQVQVLFALAGWLVLNIILIHVAWKIYGKNICKPDFLEMAEHIYDVCGQKFSTLFNLRRHLLRHVNQGRFIRCGKPFNDRHDLKSHWANQYGETKPFVCPTCEKIFSTQILLSRHQRQETRDSYIGCKKREYSAKDKDSLQTHEARHSVEWRLSCRTCGKAFKHRTSLSRHSKIHMDN